MSMAPAAEVKARRAFTEALIKSNPTMETTEVYSRGRRRRQMCEHASRTLIVFAR